MIYEAISINRAKSAIFRPYSYRTIFYEFFKFFNVLKKQKFVIIYLKNILLT